MHLLHWLSFKIAVNFFFAMLLKLRGGGGVRDGSLEDWMNFCFDVVSGNIPTFRICMLLLVQNYFVTQYSF